MTLKNILLFLWFSFSLLSPHLISTMREGDYTSMKGSKLVKLLLSQNREIRSMAFYELQRRQCPEAQESYAEFKKSYKIWEVIVCPTGPDRPPVYLVLYDYDFWSSLPDQYYSIPDREIFEKDQDKTGLDWKKNMGIAFFDSTGGSVEIPGESDGLLQGVIADINGDGFIEMVDAHRSRKIDASPRATVLKVWIIKEIPRCIFALMYNLENGDWACALEDKNNDGIYDILLGPGKPGKVTPVVAYKWDAGKEGASWATRKLKTFHPQRYINLLEQRVQKEKGSNAIEAFYQLENFAPEPAVELSKKLLAEQRKDLFVPAFRVLVRAKIITDIKNMLPELVNALTSPDTEWNRGYLIDFLVPEDNPLKYKDERIDRALGTLLDARPGDERVKYILKDICLALGRRGRIEFFFKIKEWFDKADSFSEKGDILLTLTYLALQGKGKYLTELEEILGRYLRKSNIQIGEVIYSVWAADFKQFKDRLAEIATSGPEDYEDQAAYSSGPDKDVDGRYHPARKVCALWNEKDPVTRCKLWIAFGLEDYYEIMKSPACKLRMKEELTNIASILTRKQKGDILSFMDFCHRETLDKWKRQSEIREIMRKIFLT